jgi:hypothetical protein
VARRRHAQRERELEAAGGRRQRRDLAAGEAIEHGHAGAGRRRSLIAARERALRASSLSDVAPWATVADARLGGEHVALVARDAVRERRALGQYRREAMGLRRGARDEPAGDDHQHCGDPGHPATSRGER